MTASHQPRASHPPRNRCFCGRAHRGFGYRNPDALNAPQWRLCSMKHLDQISQIKGELDMTKLTDLEIAAIVETNEVIGGHLERLGKTDVATMTHEEWCDFLAFAFRTIADAVDAQVPF